MEQEQTSSVQSLIRLIEADPLNLRNYCTLAGAYQSVGELDKAELTLRRAIEIDPLHNELWLQLGNIYSDKGEWRDSADAFEHACALESKDPDGLIRRGLALIAAQDLGAAIAVRDTLLERFPDRAESHLIAGHISKILGRFEEAAESYRSALQHDPRQTEAILNLVDLAPPGSSDPLTQSLEQLRRAAPSLSHRQAANIQFSLARIYEKAGQVDPAFSLFQEANTAAQAMLGELGNAYDPRKAEDEASQIIAMLDAGALANQLEPLDLELRMIFIVGMPRSGTTLAERVLSSHSRVSTAGELPFMQHCLSRLCARRKSVGRRGAIRLDDGRDLQLLLRSREEYLDGLFDKEVDGEYVIDKLPANFSALGLIRVLFPDALIIHCDRDPVATCWSLYTAHFGVHLSYYTSLEHLVHYYNEIYSRLMAHWRTVLGPKIIDVNYEKLVVNPEHEIRELLTHCGLSWEDACLAFHRNEQPIYTASMQQARQPLSTDSLRRWKTFGKHLTTLTDGLPDTPASRINDATAKETSLDTS